MTGDDSDVLLETLLGADEIRPRADTLPLLCRKASDLIGCDQVVIRLPDDSRTVLREAALWSSAPMESRHVDLIRNEVLAIGDLSSSIVGRRRPSPSLEAFRSGEIQVIAATDSPEEFLPAAMCVAPLVRAGSTIGVVAFYWLHPHRPGSSELQRIRAAARHVAFVIDVSERFESLRSRLIESERAHMQTASAWNADERRADFHARMLDIVADGASSPGDVIDALADVGVNASHVREGDQDAATGVQKAAGGTVYGILRSAADDPVLPIAAQTIALIDERRGRERRTTSARAASLAALVREGTGPQQTAEAESILELNEPHSFSLLVGEFVDADCAFGLVRLASTDLAEVGSDGPVGATSHTRAVMLCRSRSDVVRLAERMRSTIGYRGAGVTELAGAGRLPEALRHASTAARVSQTRGGRLITFDDVGPIAALAAEVPASATEALLADTLGSLEEYDRSHRSDLIATLNAYLAHNGSVQRAAAQLHVHLNTVKQRIARINALIDADVRDYAVAARLLLALEWRSVAQSD